MLHYHKLEKLGIVLVNFKKIFAQIQTKFLNDCTDYGLFNKDGSIPYYKSDVKRLLTHHTIHELCEEVLRSKESGRLIFFYRPLASNDTFEIVELSDVEKLNQLVEKILLKVKRLLPIQIIIVDGLTSFHQLKENLDKKDGATTELVYRILCNMVPVNLSFANIKKFARKNKLTFLSKEYFNKIQTKLLFCKINA